MEKTFLIKLFKKTLVMVGFTYFSVAITMQTFTQITPALLAGGLYCFTELARHYKLNAENKALKSRKKKAKEIHFLI